MNYVFFIIYPKGDKSKLDIAEDFDYEKNDYALASRHEFIDYTEAYEYAAELASKHNLKLVANLDRNDDNNYLD